MSNEALTLPTIYRIEFGNSCVNHVSVRGGEVFSITLEVGRDPSFLTRFGNRIKTVGGGYSRQQSGETHRDVTIPLDSRFPRIETIIDDILSYAKIRYITFHLNCDNDGDARRRYYTTSEHTQHRPGETLRECAARLATELSSKLSFKDHFATLELAQKELQLRENEAQKRKEKWKAQRDRVNNLAAVFTSLGYDASRSGYDVSLSEEAATQLLKDLRGK